jgi:hypothetical protein
LFFAATVSLALPAIALAQQSAKPGQQTWDPIKTCVAKINMNKKENTMNQPSSATQLESVRSTAADATTSRTRRRARQRQHWLSANVCLIHQ